MSEFEVKIYKAEILKHPDPVVTAIELCKVGDYLTVVRKDDFKTGDLVAYIPEQSLLPADLISQIGLTGKLSGGGKNRVKPIRLRGVVSQGIVLKAKEGWTEGQNVAEELQIKKWEPDVPKSLTGQVNSKGPLSFTFDVENIKKWNRIFKDGEEVIFTEKIHGTCFITCLVPPDLREPDMVDGKLQVISKGLAKSGLYFKDNEDNSKNVYVRMSKQYKIAEKLYKLFGDTQNKIHLLGEIYGVQDLKYALGPTDIDMRVFGIKVGNAWYNWNDLEKTCEFLELKTVPVVYRGPYSKEIMLQYTKGKEQVSGKETNIREGIVIYPQEERQDDKLGRVFLKSVSDDYLLRGNKDATEFN